MAMQRRAVLIHRLAAYAEQRGRAEDRLQKLREFCSLVSPLSPPLVYERSSAYRKQCRSDSGDTFNCCLSRNINCFKVENRIMPHEAYVEAKEAPEFKSLMVSRLAPC